MRDNSAIEKIKEDSFDLTKTGGEIAELLREQGASEDEIASWKEEFIKALSEEYYRLCLEEDGKCGNILLFKN